MKTSSHPSKAANAFTLIELLVVIAIIAILIGLLFPAFGAVREATKKVLAHNDETQIVAAVKAYYVEYGKYPIPAVLPTGTDVYFGNGAAPAGTSGTTNDVLFDVLRNNTATGAGNVATVTALNPRGIAFLDVPSVKNNSAPLSGVVPDSAPTSASSRVGAWYDPWGSQYNVLINASYSNSLVNPYFATSGTNSPGGSPISTGVLVWSFGKNGQLGGDNGTVPAGFNSEGGTAGAFQGSGDVISWQ